MDRREFIKGAASVLPASTLLAAVAPRLEIHQLPVALDCDFEMWEIIEDIPGFYQIKGWRRSDIAGG